MTELKVPPEGKKKILLINPPKHEFFPFIDTMALPTGLLKIGGYLRDLGHEVSLIDCDDFVKRGAFAVHEAPCGNYENERISKTVYHAGIPWDDFERQLLERERPDEIYVTSSMTYYWKPVHKVIELCKQRFPGVPVVLGGPYPTLCPDHARRSGADRVFVGELFEASDHPAAMDLLPFVPSFAVVKSTRGCPHHCSYCAVSILEGSRMRFRSPESVFNEMKEIVTRFGITEFHMWESNLLVNARRHLERLLDLIIEDGLHVKIDFPEGLQPNLLYPELAVKMKQAGVVRLALPLESVDEALYKDRFHRPSGLTALEKSVEMFKAAGFTGDQIRIFVLFGMPDQSLDSIIRSCREAWALGCRLTPLAYTPIPGTAEFENYRHMFEGRDLEHLHPRLWPCASPKLKVSELEEVVVLFGTSPFQVKLDYRGGVYDAAMREIVGAQRTLRAGDLDGLDPRSLPYLISFEFGEDDLTSQNGDRVVALLAAARRAHKTLAIAGPLPRCIFRPEDHALLSEFEIFNSNALAYSKYKTGHHRFERCRGCTWDLDSSTHGLCGPCLPASVSCRAAS
ncbi:MAG: radical SAM protein [Acidobacteriota bacterium]